MEFYYKKIELQDIFDLIKDDIFTLRIEKSSNRPCVTFHGNLKDFEEYADCLLNDGYKVGRVVIDEIKPTYFATLDISAHWQEGYC